MWFMCHVRVVHHMLFIRFNTFAVKAAGIERICDQNMSRAST